MNATAGPEAHSSSYSLSVEQKILIIEQLLQQITPKLPLNVQDSQRTLETEQLPIATYYYEVAGSRYRKRSQPSNLLQKLQEVQQPEDDEPRDHDESRYFNCTTRCFRCKRIGHTSVYCPQEFFCVYCLSLRHPFQKCPQKVVCFRCFEFGHVISECREPEGQFCKVCRRKHRGVCCFLAKGVEQVKEIFDCSYLENDQEIICMVCEKKGHLNCRSE